MATVTVKNIPDDLYQKLKRKAEQQRRSINSEIIFCLEQTLNPQVVSAGKLLAKAKAVREKADIYVTEKELQKLKRNGH